MQRTSRAVALALAVLIGAAVLLPCEAAKPAPKPSPSRSPIASPTPQPSPSISPSISPSSPANYSDPAIQWEDNFDTLDTNTSWKFQYGDGSVFGLWGWGNSELECYTNKTNNVAIIPDPNITGNNLLSITAVYSKGQACYNGEGVAQTTRDWTSGRIVTWGKRSFAPANGLGVRVESRIKIPLAQGVWPAFWMLPEPSTTPFGGWCASGEIDIMEHINNDAYYHGTLHFGGGSGSNSYVGCVQSTGTSGNITNPDDWHTHAVVWTPTYIAWELDGVEYYRSASSQWWSGNAVGVAAAPFTQPFYILLNLAVGGNWPGNPTGTGPYTMLVDYVRVSDVVL